MPPSFIRKVKEFVGDNLIFPSYSVRKKLSHRYLRGTGLEVGALQNPLEVLPTVTVRYVDYSTKEENVQKYPAIEPSRIVATDIVADGFQLAGIEPASQDFVIANHVLEHSPNPLQTLLNWIRVIRPGGIVFLTLPNGEKSFDCGRSITTIEHMVVDFELVGAGKLDEFTARNLEHYREFVEISIPNLHSVQRNLKTYPTEEARNAYVEKMAREGSCDAHFHVFSKDSLERLMEHVIVSHAPDVALRELVPSRGGTEFVVILEKTGENQAG